MTEVLERNATAPAVKSDMPAVSPQPPRLLDQMRERIRVKHYSLSTEKTYIYWVRFFIRWSGMQHPRDMGAAEVEGFLSFLATQRDVSAGTQNQALSAILDNRRSPAHHSPATKKNVAGIGLPRGSGVKPLCSRKRLFYACASSNGRPGGRAARPPLLPAVDQLPFRSPTRLVSGRRFKTATGGKTMDTAIKIDRETASRINPLISSLWTEDTLDTVASVVYEIGYMVAETDLAKGHVFHVFEAVSAALQWERDNIESVAQRRKERGHV